MVIEDYYLLADDPEPEPEQSVPADSIPRATGDPDPTPRAHPTGPDDEDRTPIVEYLKVETYSTKKIKKLLSDAAKEVAKDILKAVADEKTPMTVAQLAALREAILSYLAELFGTDIAAEIDLGQMMAVKSAEEMMRSYEEKLLKSIGVSDADIRSYFKSEAIRASRGVRSFMDRATSSYTPLSQSVYNTTTKVGKALDNAINQALLQGDTARDFAARIKGFIDPGTPGGASYAAMRLARTEINNAFHAGSVDRYARSGMVKRVIWLNSLSHPEGDECDDLARRKYFPIDKVPKKPHPQCLCYIVPDMMSPEEFMASLLSGKGFGPSAPAVRSMAKQSLLSRAGSAYYKVAMDADRLGVLDNVEEGLLNGWSHPKHGPTMDMISKTANKANKVRKSVLGSLILKTPTNRITGRVVAAVTRSRLASKIPAGAAKSIAMGTSGNALTRRGFRFIDGDLGFDAGGVPIVQGGAADARPRIRDLFRDGPDKIPDSDLFDNFYTDAFKKVYGTQQYAGFDINIVSASVRKAGRVFTITSSDNTANAGLFVRGTILKDGKLAGKVERYFEMDADGKLTVSHELMDISPQYRGQGFSTAFSKYSEGWYRDNGVDHIKVHAALQDGAYTWARAGYDWDPERAGVMVRQGIRNEFDDILGDGMIPTDDGFVDLPEDHKELLQRLVDDMDASTDSRTWSVKPWEIAQLKYAKDIFANTDWYGVKPIAGEAFGAAGFQRIRKIDLGDATDPGGVPVNQGGIGKVRIVDDEPEVYGIADPPPALPVRSNYDELRFERMDRRNHYVRAESVEVLKDLSMGQVTLVKVPGDPRSRGPIQSKDQLYVKKIHQSKDAADRELAASRLAEQLGLRGGAFDGEDDYVTLTPYYGDEDFEQGDAWWRKNIEKWRAEEQGKDGRDRESFMLDQIKKQPGSREIALMDWLINNPDRHELNWFVDRKTGEIIPIDSELADFGDEAQGIATIENTVYHPGPFIEMMRSDPIPFSKRELRTIKREFNKDTSDAFLSYGHPSWVEDVNKSLDDLIDRAPEPPIGDDPVGPFRSAKSVFTLSNPPKTVAEIRDAMGVSADWTWRDQQQRENGSGNPMLTPIYAAQGFDSNKPTALPSAVFDAAVRQGRVERVWRGVNGTFNGADSISGADLMKQFRTGTHYACNGVYGNGSYMSNRWQTASGYSDAMDSLSVGEFGLRNDARIIDYNDAYSQAEEFVRRMNRELKAREDALFTKRGEEMDALYEKFGVGSPGNRDLNAKGLEAMERVMAKFNADGIELNKERDLIYMFSDPGHWAALMGYDAIRAEQSARENFFVLLNRAALVYRDEATE